MGKCEICGKIGEIDRHHIQSKCLGGKDKANNLINCCLDCHRAIHKNQIVVIGRFLTMDGYKVLTRKENGLRLIVDEPEVYIMKKPTD